MEFEGFHNIYKTDESVYTRMMNKGAESEEEADKLSIDERNDLETEFLVDLNENNSVYSGDGEIPKCDAERAWEQGVELGEEE
ncbi:hypothetical protein SAMN05720764_11469 [Fibrobacter sp. UWH5]|uniref:hypothetical protein n=1 Tax=Fibrobacter sp. UWH5 TaxID=1896211 RepID=UPI00091FC634|nr:hypothetical protein [Fibrobacter sp. UWH5]SHL45919.1 hypothetical protein SAMN05720764_11469 [Fibrobacter sp. UWH5]